MVILNKSGRLGYNFARYCTKISKDNMKYLNVAEKNDAAKTIAGLLSNGTATRREGRSVYNKIYEFEANVKGTKSKMVMTSVSGHLLQLEFSSAYRRWNEVDPQTLFSAPVKKACPENNQKIMDTLQREVRSCNGLIIWTDCDREGENIGYEIIDVCCKIKPNIKIYRAVFSEITSASIGRALQRITEPNKRLSEAVDVRTELDLRSGAAITRFQTMRLQRIFPAKIADKLISYGSCQIPTLGFVAERYKEIEAFVSEPFWKIKVLHTIDDLTVEFVWARNRLFDKSACEDYFLLCLADPKAKVEAVTTKPKHKWRPTPLDTVSMEKLASRKLKISAKETMTIAEKLYSKGIISYPRTETNQFSKDIDLSALAEKFTEHPDWGSFARRINEWGANPRNGNKTDQAHPPIHPTKLVTDLHGNDARVYELVCRHFLACISKDAVGSETLVHIDIAGEKFTATGLCIYERNYLDIYVYENWNAKQIHHYEQGQTFDPTEILMPEGATTAPPLLTEADLIALMEKHGIGTDATHAEHINTIKERGYIGVVEKGGLVPGIIGMGLYEGYDAMNLELAKPLLRAAFESDLKDICEGKKDPKVVLREQIQKYLEAYRQITANITAMDNKMALRINETLTSNNATDSNEATAAMRPVVQEIFQCPKCAEAPLALKQKKNQDGFFIGCMNFPDCKNVIWLSEECLEPSVLEETCSCCGPSVKLVKLRFKSLYYKTLFKTPSGCYKTCLRCDRQFCENFNINLDQVKPSGGIINAATTLNNVPTSSSLAISTSARGVERRAAEREARNSTDTTSLPKKRGSSKQLPTKKKKTTGTTQSVKNFFTSAVETQEASSVAQSLHSVENELIMETDDALADFFNSNDDFDEMMGAVDFSMENIENTSNVNAQNQTRPSVSTTAFRSSTQVNEDTTSFSLDDFPDIPDFVWGTAEHRRRSMTTNHSSQNKNEAINTQQRTDNVWGTAEHSRQSQTNHSYQNLNETATTQQRTDNVWGTAEHSRQSQTNHSSQNINETATTQQRRYNESRRDVSATTNVKCSKCHQPAKELKVRKEGPNKDRWFYTCSKDSCKFFQWKDADSNQGGAAGNRSQQQQQSEMAWGSRHHSSQASSSSETTNAKKRKCGLCRQEGHTRSNCPRKLEFEF